MEQQQSGDSVETCVVEAADAWGPPTCSRQDAGVFEGLIGSSKAVFHDCTALVRHSGTPSRWTFS